jgi:predicted transposase YbfD/YdcC
MKSNITDKCKENEVVKSLSESFANIIDHRDKRGVRYELVPMLVLIVLAKLCGADKPIEIARFVENRASWLKEVLSLSWKRMPHHSTWRRVMQSAIGLSELEKVASEYLSQFDSEEFELLNLDGKSCRGTIAKGETNGLHLLALQESKQNIVIEQTALKAKENEISCSKRLLENANLQGKILSGDAIFAQRELSRQVVEAGGDYLWKVKANQENLLHQLEDYFSYSSKQKEELDKAKSLDKGHGRLEERVLFSSSRFADQQDWPYMSQAFVIRREAIEIRTQKKTSQVTYGITSLLPIQADATRLLELVRSHWSIENGLHYRRDVTFKEDGCRMKSHTAAEVLAVCNNLALGMIRHAGWSNVAEARSFYSAKPELALQLILMPPT